MTWACPKPCSLWIRTIGLRAVHSILILTDSTLIIPWLYVTRSGLSHWDHFLHNFIPLAILIFNSYLVELSTHVGEHWEIIILFSIWRGKTLTALTLEKHICWPQRCRFQILASSQGLYFPIAHGSTKAAFSYSWTNMPWRPRTAATDILTVFTSCRSLWNAVFFLEMTGKFRYYEYSKYNSFCA